jgi:hypothetical protein
LRKQGKLLPNKAVAVLPRSYFVRYSLPVKCADAYVKAHGSGCLTTAVLINPIRWRADTIAARLKVTAAERKRLRLTTIGAIDKTKAERQAERKERKRAADRTRRRARGAQPRADYLAQSLSRVRPWVALGMSRASWYRAGKPIAA